MNHSIHLDGHAFALRPIRLSDAAFIVELRSNLERAQYVHPIVETVEAQEKYLSDYLERDGDYYFVVEDRTTRRAEGLIALYDVKAGSRQAEAGRWILRAESLAAVESALLVYRVAFEILSLDEVRCRTAVENARVVSFHDSCGLERRDNEWGYFQFGERRCEWVEQVLTRARWPTVRDKMERLALCIF